MEVNKELQLISVKKISVILPVYNVEKYLDRCMRSIIGQTMDKRDFEVILVDDGAKDSSPEICDKYSRENDNFIVIHQENAGAAAARNAGLKRAQGEYVVFVDPDDYIETDYLETAYNLAKENKADIALFDAYRDDAVTTLWGHAKKPFATSEAKDKLSMQCQILYPYMSATVGNMQFEKDIPLSAPWDKCYRRQFLAENDLEFPSHLKVLDDMSFNFVAFGKAKKIAYTPKALYHYCIEPGSITNSYKENRPELDKQVFEYLKHEIDSAGSNAAGGNEAYDKNGSSIRNGSSGRNTESDLMQAYYARIIKSFAICCRLCFFNKKNPRKTSEKYKQVRGYMTSEPYKEAFGKVKLSNIEWKLIAVVVAGKMRSARMLKLLNDLQNK